MCSINSLYNEQQNDIQQELQKLYNQNKKILSYFSEIENDIKEAFSSSNKEEVKIMLESVKTQLSNLSQLKFSIFDLEDEIPEELSKKWNKRVKYITQQMSINEVDNFIQIIEEFEEKATQQIEESRKRQEDDNPIANNNSLRQIIVQEINKYGNSADLNHIDVKNVTNMKNLFSRELKKFDGDISKWDVSNVTNMKNMFFHSSFDGDITNWNVSKVINMEYMFDHSIISHIPKWYIGTICNYTDVEIMLKDPNNIAINLPKIGESVISAEIAVHLRSIGDYISKNEAIVEIDSDKATLEVPSTCDGYLLHLEDQGKEISIGEMIAIIKRG
jgi:hypothetical protein